MATKPKPDAANATTMNATNAAVLDPPPETQPPEGAVATLDAPPPEIDDASSATLIEVASANVTPSAEERVRYWVDPTTGRCTRAELTMSRGPTRYEARVEYDGTYYRWLERDGDEWVAVKRGQHAFMVKSIIEQAREYALNRVFGGWPG